LFIIFYILINYFYKINRVLDETPLILSELTKMGVEAEVTAYTGNPAAGKLAGKVSGNLV
jgi:hypothetical protein